MKVSLLPILLIILLYSCSPKAEKQPMNNNIIGQWETELCRANCVHGSIKVSNPVEIEKFRIPNKFSITFNPDSTFALYKPGNVIETGKYTLMNDSIILTLKGDSFTWLEFQVDSLIENKLYLKENMLPLYFTSNDSTKFYTGDNVRLILHKK